MEKNNRQTYFDFLRGFAILMVVGIHTYTVRPFDGAGNIAQIGVREAINFAVPLFLAISGFFLGKKKINSSKEYFAFLRKQLPRVYIPAVMWSLPMIAVCILRGQNALEYIGKGLLCMTFGPYYFIVLIMQLYILLPLVRRLSIKPILGAGVVLIINTISIIALVYMLNVDNLPNVISVGPFVYWIIFFYIGVCLSESKRDYGLAIPLIILAIGYASQIFETKYLMSLGKMGIGLKFSTWCYSAGMILFLFSTKIESVFTKHGLIYKGLVKVGEISFGIYLAHVYFLMLKRIVLSTNNWILSFVFVAAATILLVSIMKAVIPAKYWRVLGLI